MAKTYFTSDLFVFLEQLKRNNRRDWFLKHKDRFEEVVRQPCLHFITDFGFRLHDISSWVIADPKPIGGSLFRIYRDVRFSKDKTPYKTHVGMHFRHATTKDDVHGPSFYLHLDPSECFMAGGCWQPEPRSLAKMRDAISWQPDEWKAAKRGLTMGGESLSRPPRGYAADHPQIEDLKRKEYVALIEFTRARMCGAQCMNDVVAAAKKLSPLMGFLSKSLGMRF